MTALLFVMVESLPLVKAAKNKGKNMTKSEMIFCPPTGLSYWLFTIISLQGKAKTTLSSSKTPSTNFFTRPMLSIIIPKGKIYSQRLIEYNPNLHQSLAYLAPVDYIEKELAKIRSPVLPMWSATTHSCQMP